VDILHVPVSEISVMIKIISMVPKIYALQVVVPFVGVFITWKHANVVGLTHR
jgi:hypothetical protein